MIALIRKNLRLWGYGKSLALFAGCILFSISGRLNGGIAYERHILSAVSDHYYLTYFVLPIVLLSCFSFIDDDGEPVILRFQSYHSYFLKKWIGVGLIAVILTAVQTGAILLSGIGLPLGNEWNLAAGATEAELFSTLEQLFASPLQAFVCFTLYQLTRTFEEVTGKDIRRIHQMPIPFLPEEREVYNIVLKEFYRIQREYYNSTGNSRKDALMRLIQQITLLLRISAAPDCMKEYEGETPLKEVAVVEALARWPDEIVAIGVRHTTVLDRYAAAIREYLPDRPLFVVTGSTVPSPSGALCERYCGTVGTASCSARSRAFPPASTSSLSTRSSFRRCTTTTPA